MPLGLSASHLEAFLEDLRRAGYAERTIRKKRSVERAGHSPSRLCGPSYLCQAILRARPSPAGRASAYRSRAGCC